MTSANLVSINRDSVYAFDLVVNLYLECALICYCQPGKNYPGLPPIRGTPTGAENRQPSSAILFYLTGRSYKLRPASLLF